MNIGGVSLTANSSSLTASAGLKEIPTNRTGRVRQSEQHHDRHQDKIKEEHNGKLSKEEVEHIVKGMNEFLQPKFTSVVFKLHEELDRYYVEVIDKETKEVVREIPDKEILDMYAKMTEYLGLFIDKKL
ncbi:hypothetical protein J27TS8_40460 [Robertmurraya siralis]|uniref:Flagellar protein FlaG n=1 Tax=Robertmurraya siralis TaxID=77777 RepID=A0A920BVL3_9BACI|nr:flagellar protein FlaG [Robertmurraya siralis]GIN64053.1 hypothetical protein J27TS8_40460 [Robertmurraya siralis]